MKEKVKLVKIYCPHCKAEYLPGEIYIPNALVGQPEYVEREYVSGEIKDQYKGEMQLGESYICDRCNKPFKVYANVEFRAYPDNQVDFEETHKTSLKKEQIFLNED